MLELDLTLIISFLTLAASFFNTYQVNELKIKFHSQSRIFDLKFEKLIELEKQCTMHHVNLNKLLSMISCLPNIKHRKEIDDLTNTIYDYHLNVSINKKLLKDTKLEDALHKTSVEALVSIFMYISGNKEGIEKQQFLSNIYINLEEIEIHCCKLMTKYHNLKYK